MENVTVFWPVWNDFLSKFATTGDYTPEQMQIFDSPFWQNFINNTFVSNENNCNTIMMQATKTIKITMRKPYFERTTLWNEWNEHNFIYI